MLFSPLCCPMHSDALPRNPAQSRSVLFPPCDIYEFYVCLLVSEFCTRNRISKIADIHILVELDEPYSTV